MPSKDRTRIVKCPECGLTRCVTVSNPGNSSQRCRACATLATIGKHRPDARKYKPRTCPVCKKEFYTDVWRTTVCSIQCYGVSRRRNVFYKCKRCGQMFARKPSAKDGIQFCSFECLTEPEIKSCLVCTQNYVARSIQSKLCGSVCRSFVRHYRRRYGQFGDKESIEMIQKLFAASRKVMACRRVNIVLNDLANGKSIDESQMSEVLATL